MLNVACSGVRDRAKRKLNCTVQVQGKVNKRSGIHNRNYLPTYLRGIIPLLTCRGAASQPARHAACKGTERKQQHC